MLQLFPSCSNSKWQNFLHSWRLVARTERTESDKQDFAANRRAGQWTLMRPSLVRSSWPWGERYRLGWKWSRSLLHIRWSCRQKLPSKKQHRFDMSRALSSTRWLQIFLGSRPCHYFYRHELLRLRQPWRYHESGEGHGDIVPVDLARQPDQKCRPQRHVKWS